jgi:CDP-diacylglycerol--glycerol-3-phosphate 3-phosphatidyltransferase
MACLFVPIFSLRVLALFFFILALLTDIYDGRLARRKNQITSFGILLDPVADKILISTAFISFVGIPELCVPAMFVAIIIAREFLIMGLRLLASSDGKILPAEKEGKQKTVFQMGGIVIILIYLIAKTRLISLSQWSEKMEIYGRGGVLAIMSIILISTVLSGYHYLKKYGK